MFTCEICKSPMEPSPGEFKRLSRGERVSITCRYCGVANSERSFSQPARAAGDYVEEPAAAEASKPTRPGKSRKRTSERADEDVRSAKGWLDESASVPAPPASPPPSPPPPAAPPQPAWGAVLPGAVPPSAEPPAAAGRVAPPRDVPPPPFGRKSAPSAAAPPAAPPPAAPPPAAGPAPTPPMPSGDAGEARPSLMARFDKLPKVVQYAALLVMFLGIGIPAMLAFAPPTPPRQSKGPAPAPPAANPTPPTPTPPEGPTVNVVEDRLPGMPPVVPPPPPKGEPLVDPLGPPDAVFPPKAPR